MIELNQAKSVTRQIYRAIQFTRAEAIKRGESVVLCPLDKDTGACTSDWNQELMSFADSNGDGTRNASENILLTVPEIPAGTLQAKPGFLKMVRFNGLGFSPGVMGNLTYCPRDENTTPTAIRRLIFTMNGRTRWAQDKDSDGVIEDSGGSPVSCSNA
nr:GspH/FimT family protein [Marinobacter bryozoorum]